MGRKKRNEVIYTALSLGPVQNHYLSLRYLKPTGGVSFTD